MMIRKKVTVITCAYNEEGCIEELARRLAKTFDQLPKYQFEVLIIDNCSTDSTQARALKIAQADSRFRVVELARNFGFDGGLSAGLSIADGDAVVLMAADLEDPPEAIEPFVEKWEEGYENVYGVITARTGTNWKRRLNSRLFYAVIGRLADHPIPPNARDFRLLDRRVYEELRNLDEHIWFLRGLVAWIGGRSIGVEFEQSPRFAGSSKAATWPIIEFAVKAIFAHSLAPLRIMPLFGLLLSVGSFLALIAMSAVSLIAGVPFPGFGTIVALILFLFGILFCFLSIIGIYIGLIFEQVRRRPSFMIRNIHEGPLLLGHAHDEEQ